MQPRWRVVCIDDEPEVIDLIRLILSQEGIETIGAESGPDGLEAIRREKPHAVLLDLMLPEMDGWDVYKALKAGPSTRDIPVIVISAKAQPIDRALGLQVAGVDAYLTKPFRPQELLDCLANVLRN
jgi:two-component system, OmpR family, response regulator VicR